MSLFKWIKKSFEFKGRASEKKLTVFTAFVFLCSMAIYHMYTGRQVQSEFIHIFSLIVMIGSGLMTAQNIVDIFKRGDTYAEDVYNLGNKKRPDGSGGAEEGPEVNG